MSSLSMLVPWNESSGTEGIATDTYIELGRAGDVVLGLIETINRNRLLLSEIDGAIGDGDHGINMSKGFSQCRDQLLGLPEMPGLPEALEILAMRLMDGIGGSTGPLYGSFFLSWSQTLAGHERMDAELFGHALACAVDAVRSVGNAQVGDKTMIDTLVPACEAYAGAMAAHVSFDSALSAMKNAAEQGMESTRALQARVGRASRLGERSIGVLDAGATSCCLLLQELGSAMQSRLGSGRIG